MKIKFIITGLVLILLTACKSTPTTIGSFYSYETECLGLELDGSQTLRVWGEGKNKSDAVEQAKKNAVRDVLFRGIRKGKEDCNLRPLMLETNAQEKYEDYFNAFFADGGEYKKYVSSKDEKRGSKEMQANQLGKKYGVTVRVLRSELKKKLKADGLI